MRYCLMFLLASVLSAANVVCRTTGTGVVTLDASLAASYTCKDMTGATVSGPPGDGDVLIYGTRTSGDRHILQVPAGYTLTVGQNAKNFALQDGTTTNVTAFANNAGVANVTATIVCPGGYGLSCTPANGDKVLVTGMTGASGATFNDRLWTVANLVDNGASSYSFDLSGSDGALTATTTTTTAFVMMPPALLRLGRYAHSSANSDFGRLDISGTVVVKGDVIDEFHNSVAVADSAYFRVLSGGALQFAGGKRWVMGMARRWQGGVGAFSKNHWLYVDGGTIEDVAAGASGYSYRGFGDVFTGMYWNNATFRNLGNAATPWFDTFAPLADSWTWTRNTFDGVSGFQIRANLGSTVACTVTGNTWANSTAAEISYMTFTSNNDVCVWSRNIFDKPVGYNGGNQQNLAMSYSFLVGPTTISGPRLANSIMYNYPCGDWVLAASSSDVLFVSRPTTPGPGGCHGPQVSAGTHTNWVMQYTTTGASDGFHDGPVAAVTLIRPLILPRSNHTTGASEQAGSPLLTLSAAAPSWKIQGATFAGDARDNFNNSLQLDESSVTPANSITYYRNNSKWDWSARGNHVNHEYANPANNQITVSGIGYNACYLCVTASASTWRVPQWGAYTGQWQNAEGTYYNIIATTPIDTSHDVTGNPRFVDSTRNIESWAYLKTGTQSIEAAWAYVKADLQNRIPELMDWLRAGHLPQNPVYWNSGCLDVALDGTCEGSTFIGAVDPAPLRRAAGALSIMQ